MPIAVDCASCSAKLKVADNLTGRAFKCPKCGNVSQVPGPAAPAAARPAPPPVPAPAPAAAKSAPPPVPAVAAAPKPKPASEDAKRNGSNPEPAAVVKAARKAPRDEDEDDPNVRPVAGAKKKSRRDEEDDEDEPKIKSARKARDEEDEDDDDPNVRSVAGAKKKSRRDEEDEDEDEPRSKKSKSAPSDEEEDENVKSTSKKNGGGPRRTTEEVLEASVLPAHLKDQAEAALTQGERLVWLGQPSSRLMVKRSLPIAIGIGGFLLIMIIIVLTIMSNIPQIPFVMKLAPMAFLGLFLAGAVSAPFLARMRAHKTMYAITNRRALVWSCNVLGYVSFTIYTPEQLQNMWRSKGWFMSDQDSGDLVFKAITTITYSNKGTSRSTTYYGFLAILNAQAVEAILRETLLAPSKKKKKRRRDEDEDEDEDD